MAYTENFIDTTGNSRKLQLRFHRESRLRYRVSSVEELFADNFKVLKELVEHHKTRQRPRIQELYDYAEGNNHDVLTAGRRKDKDMADRRSVHNFAKVVSSFKQGYMLGSPVRISYDDGEDESAVDKALSELSERWYFHQLNRGLILDMSQVGRAYDLVYRSPQDETKVVRLNPLETFVVYDTTVENRPIAGVRYYREGLFSETDTIVEVYTDNRVARFSTKEGYRELDSSPHAFGAVPITEYLNNTNGLGDYETELYLIDLYDSAESDTANHMSDLADAILLLVGDIQPPDDLDEKGQQEWMEAMKRARFMWIQPPSDVNGNAGNIRAEYLTKTYDVTGVEAYKTRLVNDIHKFTNTPDMTDEHFASSQSGVAMKWKIFGLEQARIDTQASFEMSLRRRYQLIAHISQVLKEFRDFDIAKLRIKFTPNLPADTDGMVSYIKALYGIVSEETTLEMAAGVTEVKAQDELIRLENQAQAEVALEPRVSVQENEVTDGQEAIEP